MSYGIFIFLCSNDNFYARFQRNIENSICADSNLSRQPNSPIDWPGFNPAIVCSAVALIHILLPFLCISKRGVPSLRKLFVTTCSTSECPAETLRSTLCTSSSGDQPSCKIRIPSSRAPRLRRRLAQADHTGLEDLAETISDTEDGRWY